MEMGDYATYFGSITAGGQLGPNLGAPDSVGRQAHRFGYLIDVTGRTTSNAIEPPQPNDQTAHNAGESESYFGNFSYQAGPHDDFKLTLNSTSALTQVANRTGLPASFASVGQGFGFVGLRNADGTVPLASSPTALGAATMILPSQQADGQDIYTRDGNNFGVLNYRHNFNPKLTAMASFGEVHSSQSVLNNNPLVNQSALPIDSSIEYNPAVVRNEHQDQVQASLTYSGSRHTLKGGILSDEQIGNEFYQLIPASQLALDSEAANAPNLVAMGHVQTNSKGAPVLDAAGNPVYIANAGATAPALSVYKTGFYRAAYVQDTWGVTKKLTLNYGLRLDWYKSDQTILGVPSASGSANQANVSPRFNSAYKIDKSTVFRASFNRLFIQSPQSQGSVVGNAIVPETLFGKF